ncbi:MAG: TagF domain-containing protein [Phycisphaeraceae bacterium]
MFSDQGNTSAAPAGDLAVVAAFGKHPGWDDHIEDIGLNTALLVQIKRELYLDAIAGNINGGSWQHLDARDKLPGFNHLFLMRRQSHLVVGRLWSSSDGVGRRAYPMVVCAQLPGSVPLTVAIDHAGAYLEQLKAGCEAAVQSDAVREAVAACQQAIARAPAATLPSPEPSLVDAAAIARTACDGEVGFDRVIYHLTRERQRLTTDATTVSFRLPAAEAPGWPALRHWWPIVRAELGSGPLTLIGSPDHAWVDTVAGPLNADAAFALLASPARVPLVSSIPYDLDAGFIQGVHARYSAPVPSASAAARPATDRRPSPLATLSGDRVMLALVAAALALLVLVVLVVLVIFR